MCEFVRNIADDPMTKNIQNSTGCKDTIIRESVSGPISVISNVDNIRRHLQRAVKETGLPNSQDIDRVVADSFDEEGAEMVADDAKRGSIPIRLVNHAKSEEQKHIETMKAFEVVDREEASVSKVIGPDGSSRTWERARNQIFALDGWNAASLWVVLPSPTLLACRALPCCFFLVVPSSLFVLLEGATFRPRPFECSRILLRLHASLFFGWEEGGRGGGAASPLGGAASPPLGKVLLSHLALLGGNSAHRSFGSCCFSPSFFLGGAALPPGVMLPSGCLFGAAASSHLLFVSVKYTSKCIHTSCLCTSFHMHPE